jgi:peptide/nickel transport system substrate-binding protein
VLTACHRAAPPADTVVVLIENSPNDLDPRIGTDAYSEHIGALIFDSLLRKDDHFNLQPWLAESYAQPDPLTWTFHLRRGVRFHDGRQLTSADVAWTLNSILTGKVLSAKTGNYAAIRSVETPDDWTVIIHLSRPDAALPFNLSDGAIGIVPRGELDMRNHPIGSGPFRFVAQTPDKEVILERNPAWWQPPSSIPRVRFAVTPDATTRALELEHGTADVALNALTADMMASLSVHSNLVIDSTPGAELNYINFNVQDPALADRRVRQAIQCALDRPLILQTLWRGRGRISNSLLPPGHWAYADVTTSLACPLYNPAHARQMLDASGRAPDASGVRLRLTMKTTTDETSRLLGLIVQQQLAAVGIAVTLRPAEFAGFYADVTRGAFQMYPLRWVGGNEDPDIFRLVFSSASQPPHGYNRGRYINPELDALIAAANAETDQSRRAQLYARVQQILAADVPSINLWYLDSVLVHSKRLVNAHPSPSDDYYFLVNATLR